MTTLFTDQPGFSLLCPASNNRIVPAFYCESSLTDAAIRAGKDEVGFLLDVMAALGLTMATLLPTVIEGGQFRHCPTGTSEGRMLQREPDGKLKVGDLTGFISALHERAWVPDGTEDFTDLEQNLGLLSEEALEISTAVHKALRFGLHDASPIDGRTPLARIISETGDFEAVKRILLRQGVFTQADIDKAAHEKLGRLRKFYKFPKALKRAACDDYLDQHSRPQLARAILVEMMGARSTEDGRYTLGEQSWDPETLLSDEESAMALLERFCLTADWQAVAHGGWPTATVRLNPSGEFEGSASHRSHTMAIAIAVLRAHRLSKA